MIVIKGFFASPKLVDNLPKSTAVLGELSQYAMTFAKDVKAYTKTGGQSTFNLFSCKDDNVSTELTQTYADIATDVGEWAYTVAPTITNNATKIDFAQMCSIEFGSKIRSVQCGDIISDTLNRLPKWISWEVVGPATVYRYKVWFSGADFEASYDEFEIVIVPPLAKPDLLFSPYADLLISLAANDLSVIHDRVTEYKQKFPETLVRTEMVDLIDRTNKNNKVRIGWTAIIYGPAGDTTDYIKDAIKTYISKNSTNTESDWRILMPDLFSTTCFYIIPRWDKMAIPSRLTMPGIYSPVVNAKENLDHVCTVLAASIPKAHIEANLETTIHRYKSISFSIVGGVDNRLNLFKFTDYFTDYIAEESVNEDFNRQTKATMEITNLLTTMFLKADTFKTDPTLPANMRILDKNNLHLLVAKYNNIEYYMLMKPVV